MSSTNGALDRVVDLNSSSVVQPEPSSLVPEKFSKCPSGAFIFFSFEANSFRRDFAFCLICCFSSSETSLHSELFFMVIEAGKSL